MSKRFTSLLFVALAAMLLSASAQAQANQRTKYPLSKVLPAYLQQLKQEVDLAANPEFRKLPPQEQKRILEEAKEQVKKNSTKEYGQLPYSFISESKQVTLDQAKTAFLKKSNRKSASSAWYSAPRKAGEATDANGIITSPAEGQQKSYLREGTGYFVSNQTLYYEPQSGYANLVECADGTVYMKDIVSHYTGGWVKGTKSGNTITFPAAQPLSYNYSYATTLSLYWANIDGNQVIKASGDITFQVDGDVIKLVGSSEEKFIAVFWDDDDSWSGYGDWETVLTYDPDYVPASTDLVTPPEGLETEIYKLTGQSYSSYGASSYTAKVELGIDGNDYYIKGIFKEDFPDSWIKGTREGDIITFPKLQFLGMYSNYNIWAIGITPVDDEDFILDDFKMKYDAENQKLVALNELVANAKEDDLYYLTWLGNISISLVVGEEDTAQTGQPIDELPYTNSFDTEEEQAAFGVIDSNEDDNSWGFNSGNAVYNYTSEDADDWLVSPAIYLQAGRAYEFSIDAWSESLTWPERVEVKLGAAPKASSMNQQIIEPTDLLWTDAKTLEGIFSVSEAGYYHVGIHAISDGDMWKLNVDNFKLEEGAQPLAPNEVTNLTIVSQEGDGVGAIINFTAPTTTVSGNPLTQNLSKIEIYRDNQIIKTFENVAPGTEINYIDQEEGLTIGVHAYQVIPYNEEGIGMKSRVVNVFLTTTITLPYDVDFTDPNTLTLFKVVDANEDGTTWTYNNDYHYANVSWNSSQSADDYLISMPIQMKAGKGYHLSIDISARLESYPERFEVLIGNEDTPEALTTTLIPATEITGRDIYTVDFNVETDGKYYVAVHGISDADMFALCLYSLTITQELTSTSLQAPRVIVQPDPYGLSKAVVTVVAPDKTIDGTKVSGNISKLTVYRNGYVYKNFEDLKPGDTKVFVDTNINGTYSYRAVAYDAAGDPGQLSEKVTNFIGLDVPADPTNVIAKETTEGVNISWDPVTTGENGGIVIPSEIVYTLYNAHQEDYWFGTMWVLDDEIATTKETSISVPYDNSVDQDIAAVFVLAGNEVGESEGTGVLFFIGQPDAMPYEEHFGGVFDKAWLYNYSAEISASYSTESSDEDNSSISFSSTEDGQFGYFQSGKIAMREGNPTLLVDVKGEGAAKNRFLVKVVDANGNITTLTSVPVTNEFKTVKVSLADYSSDPFVEVQLYCDLKGAGNIIFDNVKVSDLLEYNLSASIDAPKSINVGQTANINITVKNEGERPAKDFTVKLFAGEEQLINEKVTSDLASFATKELTAKYATTIFDDAANITLRAEVEYDLDLDDEDNIAESELSIKQSNAGQPENVTAQKNGNDVTISWSAPATGGSQEVFEDFENGLGGWTVLDADGDGLTWEHHINTGSGNYSTHSGDGLVHSASWTQATGALQPDNWLVSPMASLNGTFSFWAVGQDADYAAEHFAVFVSTTSATDISSFVKVSSEFVATGNYKEYSVDLSSYAGQTGWIAIRHYNISDMFEIVIDDITYSVGGGAPVKYNVYVDRKLYDDTTGTSLVVKNTTAKSFAVSAVYLDGSESKPVEVILSNASQEPTSIEEVTGNNNPVDIYSLDGKLVRQQATDLKGLKGVYIIEGQKVIVK